MSSKINLYGVVRGHLSTLVDANTAKHSLSDVLTFYVFPIALAILGAVYGVDFSIEAINLLVTAGALFTGLLLNLLILVYDQKNKLPPVNADESNWSEVQTRHTVLKELYYNISYSTFMSVMVVVVSIVHIFIVNTVYYNTYKIDFNVDISSVSTSPILVFLGVNLVLTIFMIIKRIYTLLSSET